MEQGFQKDNFISLLNRFLYLIFFCSLFFSWRAISSISPVLILLVGLLTNRESVPALFQRRPANYFLAGCTLFYLLQFVSLLYSSNQEEGWKHIRLTTGIMIMPLAVFCSGYINRETAKKLLLDFSLLLAIASLYCLAMVFIHFLRSGDAAVFFYHQLVSPLKQHAVYFSIFVFTALVFLLESTRKKFFLTRKVVYIALAIFFSVFLFLLSSKLVIAFFIAYLFFYFIHSLVNKGRQKKVSLFFLALLIISAGLVLMIPNPISKRFSEIIKGDIGLVKQQQYSPADYFNGLQFRVLQWKLVPEILRDNKAWLAGVGAGDAQYYLDKKYTAKKMYIGDPARNDRGFLGYNTHDQFLQSLLQNGIIGLIVFLFICFSLLRMGWPGRGDGSFFIILLLLAFALTESVFETQYGIILFTFFPLLVYYGGTGQDSDI